MRKEIPILYSTPMVQAKLEGRKTMTRRVIKPQPAASARSIEYTTGWKGKDFGAKFYYPGEPLRAEITDMYKCPYGKPGDLMWVRESVTSNAMGDAMYKADFTSVIWSGVNNDPETFFHIDDITGTGNRGYVPSIHLKKKFSRIWEEVVSIRVERLQDISDADILAEGVRYPVSPKEGDNVSPVFQIGKDNGALSFMPKGWQKMPEQDMQHHLLFAHWAELWCDINGRESWDANPWVWVVETKTLSTTGKPDNL